MPNLRQSIRAKIPTQRVLESTALSARVEKRCSPRLARLNTSVTNIKSKHHIKRCPSELQVSLGEFIVDDIPEICASSESDSESDDSDFDTDCPSSPDGEEFANLSGDNIEYMAGEDLACRDSYDSRIESGNEEYEINDFVVDDDDESDGKSEAGSEITITQNIVGNGRSMSFSSAGESETERDGHSVEKSGQSRKDSTTSSGSESSGLFVTDDDEGYGISVGTDSEAFFKLVGDEVDPADVAEEIVDAVSRFTRRCNRHCEPLRLNLTSAMFGDDEVAGAIHMAVEQGMGMYEKMYGSRLLCTVGPKKLSSPNEELPVM
ncbi:hypothetical protein DE146DRAFT_732508 [Phaeosphaeria sp. MPI-PUGE-AT-0046c]|nr:hypothetical protein DE146DRAFT_732508 [Phaeosphaeria sp. MPI-PUGE-AT-0046c]